MNIQYVFSAAISAKLTNRLQKGQRLNITHRAADLDNGNIDILGVVQNLAFYLVGNVGNNLNRPPKIIPTPLLTNNRIVNLTGREIRFLGKPGRGESLIVSQIEISFSTIIGDKNFAMLKRAHSAGVNINIWVHLLHGDPQPPGFHESADGCRRQTFPQGGNDATGDEQKLGLHKNSSPRASRELIGNQKVVP